MTPSVQTKIQQHCENKLHLERDAINPHFQGHLRPDGLQNAFDLATQYALNKQLASKLRRIENALARERAGLYGYCQNCGEAMWERLIALPYAEFCTECQRKLEKNTVRRWIN